MVAIAALGSILGGSTVAYATESHAPRAGADARTYDWDPIDKEYKLNGAYPCEVAFEQDWRNPSWPIDLVNTAQGDRRVWPYENFDKSGKKQCIPPGAARKVTDNDLKHAMVLRIGAKKKCP